MYSDLADVGHKWPKYAVKEKHNLFFNVDRNCFERTRNKLLLPYFHYWSSEVIFLFTLIFYPFHNFHTSLQLNFNFSLNNRIIMLLLQVMRTQYDTTAFHALVAIITNSVSTWVHQQRPFHRKMT
jgi:hypothetical protein